jgi:phosphate transport system substrate-binding protein
MKRGSIIAAVAVFATASISTAGAALINGAGATFPYPLYSKWFSEYQKVDADTRINYQSIGSGGGIRQFQEKTVDFGATDSPMTDEQLAKTDSKVLHVPTVLGAVVVTYNLPELNGSLKLTSDVVADLFLGNIKKWNDPRLAALNPGNKLPETDVFVVHRSDGSGTTGIFTDYLAKVSPDWSKAVGKGTAVNWPTGLGGKGNEGVTGLVKQTPGAVGYVELIYAESNKLPYADIRNQKGEFVTPSMKSVTAAAAGAVKAMPEDFRISITDADGKGAYPISGFTYLLIRKELPKDKGGKLVKFLQWALKDGQKHAEPLHYAPLPPSLVKKVEAKVKEIQLQ